MDTETLDEDVDTYQENLALPAPTLSGTVVSTTREDISWTAVSDPSLKYYVLYRGIGPGNETTLTSIAANKTSFISTNLQPNTNYCWLIRTINTANERSAPSNEVCLQTPGTSPTPAPTNVTATAISDSRITVTWSAVAGATVYRVFRAQGAGAFSQVGSVLPPTTTYTSANLAAGTTYSFYVTATTVNGESVPSATATATTFSLGVEGFWKFDEKSGTTATDTSGFARNGTLTSAAFSTDRPPVDISHNKSVASISSSSASSINVPAQSAFDFGNSPFSLSVWVKLPVVVNTDIVGTQAASCGTVGWKLRQDSTNGLNLTGGGGTRAFGANLAAGTWTHVAFTYGSGTLKTYVNGAQTSTGAYTPSNTIAGTKLTVGHVGGCAGGAVLVDQLRIYSRTLSATEVGTLGATPAAPTLTVTSPTATNQVLTWTAVPNATQYFVYKGTAAGNEMYFTSVPASSLSFTGQHLTPLTQYSWYVRSEVGDVASNPSNEVIQSTPDYLPAPTVTATALSSTRVSVSWTAVTGATSYKIYKSTAGGAYIQVGAVLTPTLTYTAANLTTMTAYSFKVAAVDSAANLGVLSAAADVTTP